MTRPERRQLLAYFEETWALYEGLFESTDAFEVAPDPLRHPLIFYLGHTAAFYLNKLQASGLLKETSHPRLQSLLAVGVDPATSSELDKGIEWPRVAEVRAFRDRARERVLGLIASVPLPEQVTPEHPLWALYMGFEHDRIHLETSSVLIRQLPLSRVRRPAWWRYAPAKAEQAPAPTRFIEVPPGPVCIGRPGLEMFAWDNELGSLEAEVPAFEAQSLLVRNEDFLAFIEEGGYARRELWCEAGWAWREGEGARHPRFWVERDGALRYRAMFDEMDLPLDWPAEVNAFEAEAYCRWLGPGHRLPSEAEHRRMADEAPLVQGDVIEGGRYNINLAYGSPTPVGMMARGCSARGFHDLYGNVWRWLRDDFQPLAGFTPHPLYPDFSSPYFDEDHAAMVGGSWASTGTSASRHYRLWFRRCFFQHAGFRVTRARS